MYFESLQIKGEHDGKIQIITVNRPEALNALNAKVLEELNSALSFFQESSSVKVLILTGQGEKAFVAGADIKEMQSHSQSEAKEMAQRGQKVFTRLQNYSIPVIAAVNGFALGGGLELALSCDFILASEKAKMGLPEVSLGLIPGYGGTQRLARTVGKAWARRLILSGEMITAEKAKEIGLVTEVLPSEGLIPAALTLARVIASRAPVAMALAKQAINEGFETNLTEAMELEAELFSKTFTTEDQKEGITAFLEKRKPLFKGK